MRKKAQTPRPGAPRPQRGESPAGAPIHYELLLRLDAFAGEVTDREAKFLDSLLRQGQHVRLSPKQQAVVKRMAEKYLQD